jgi:hypothetical protein
MPDTTTWLLAAVLVVVAIVVIGYVKRRREGFASQRAQEVFQASNELFGRTTGGATFSDYKTAVPGPVDAVQYSDIKGLWKRGSLTPDTVQAAL